MSSGPDVHHSVAVSMYKFSGYHPSLMLHDHLLQIGSCKLLENPKCSPPTPEMGKSSRMFGPMVLSLRAEGHGAKPERRIPAVC